MADFNTLDRRLDAAMDRIGRLAAVEQERGLRLLAYLDTLRDEMEKLRRDGQAMRREIARLRDERDGFAERLERVLSKVERQEPGEVVPVILQEIIDVGIRWERRVDRNTIAARVVKLNEANVTDMHHAIDTNIITMADTKNTGRIILEFISGPSLADMEVTTTKIILSTNR